MKILVNAISSFRLAAGFFVISYVFSGAWLAALIWLIAGVSSDLIDGPLARRYCVETLFGKILDLVADITIDQLIVWGLFFKNEISVWFLLVMTVSIVLIRIPAVTNLKSFWCKFGLTMYPVYGIGMAWIIMGNYALHAFGMLGLTIFIRVAIPVVILIMWLKRDRIKSEFQKLKAALN